jgi:hypothetical protein
MLLPDLRGCELHGMAEWRIYHYPPRAPMGRCLACTRALYHQRKGRGRGPYMGDRCVNGHLKTPWSWVSRPLRDGDVMWYCKTCADLSARRRYLARSTPKRRYKSKRAA